MPRKTKPKDTVLRGVVREIELSLLDSAGWNPQEMAQRDFDLLVKELQDTGQIDPIQVVPLEGGRFRILGGHSRTEAARQLGWERISCVVLTDQRFQDEDLQKFLTVRLNVLHGHLNPEKMATLYRQMADRYGEEAIGALMGFSDVDALRKLVTSVSKGLKKSGLPEDMVKKFDKASQKAKTGMDLSNILKHLFEEYGNTLEHNFMVFVYGGKKHLYVAANDDLWKRLKALSERCREAGTDLNAALLELLEQAEIPPEEGEQEFDARGPDR